MVHAHRSVLLVPPSPAPPDLQDRRSARGVRIAIVVFVCAVVGGLLLLRARGDNDGDAHEAGKTPASRANTQEAAASSRDAQPAVGRLAVVEAPGAEPSSRTSKVLGWGRGPGRIGRAHADDHGPSTQRLAVDREGSAYLLDGDNGRVVRLLADGGAGDDMVLPVDAPVAMAVTQEGGLALLSRGADGRVTLTNAKGHAVGTIALPEDLAGRARSVSVVGRDVYVRSRSGEYRHVGDVSGASVSGTAIAPGAPTRDGRAYVTALLPSANATEIHVFVIDRDTRVQRWSRLVRPGLLVEGIVMADADLQGDVYVIVTGRARTGEPRFGAELLCLDGGQGDMRGSVELPVNLGPEAISDAKVTDAGEVVFTVSSAGGLRVERVACR